MDDSIILVYCTVPSIAEAKKIAGVVIEKRMAACCSIIENVTSIFHWQNKIEEAQEVLLLIKTTGKIYQQLEKEIKMIHSYSVPEIMATTIDYASSAFKEWVQESTNQ